MENANTLPVPMSHYNMFQYLDLMNMKQIRRQEYVGMPVFCYYIPDIEEAEINREKWMRLQYDIRIDMMVGVNARSVIITSTPDRKDNLPSFICVMNDYKRKRF